MAIDDLLDVEDPAWPVVQEWVRTSTNEATILPADPEDSAAALEAVGVTTASTMGAVVYHTGGVLFDGGWLRLLGSGSGRLPRSLPEWNVALAPEGRSSLEGRYLVADDAVGGFFAVNGGWFDSELGTVHYFAPDTLEWESLHRGYTEFVLWCCAGDVAGFYEAFRWPGWEADVEALAGDETFAFSPPLFTREAGAPLPARRTIPALEAWRTYHDDDESE